MRKILKNLLLLVGGLVVVAVVGGSYVLFGWSSNYPEIVFYGRVIDQHQQPVVGAEVYSSISRSGIYGTNYGGASLTITDGEGYFFIKTEGTNLVLGGAKHDAIDRVSYDTHRRLIDYDIVDERIGSIHFQRKESTAERAGYGGHESKETAYLVHAWRMTEPHQGAIGSRLTGYYNADGSEYTLTLFPARRRGTAKLGRHAGQFILSCIRPHMESMRDYGDWSFSLTPIDGGLQKTEDLYLNLAPLDGYQSSLEIEMIEGSAGYREKKRNQRYYFVANNGEYYGSLILDILPFANDSKEACIVNLKYRINPTGLRNLELLQKTP